MRARSRALLRTSFLLSLALFGNAADALRFRARVKDAVTGELLSGVRIRVEDFNGPLQDYASDPHRTRYSEHAFLTSKLELDFEGGDRGFAQRQVVINPQLCRAQGCYLDFFLEEKGRPSDLSTDVERAELARLAGEFDRVAVLLGSHLERARKLDSDLAFATYLLLVEAQGTLCVERGTESCPFAREGARRLLDLLAAEPKRAARVTRPRERLDALVRLVSERDEVEREFRAPFVIAMVWERTCEAADQLRQLEQKLVGAPERWLRHGIDQARVVVELARLAEKCAQSQAGNGEVSRKRLSEFEQALLRAERIVPEAQDLIQVLKANAAKLRSQI